MKKIAALFMILIVSVSYVFGASAAGTGYKSNIDNALSFYKTAFEADYSLPADNENYKKADVWTLYCLKATDNINKTDYSFLIPKVDANAAAGYTYPADVAKDILAAALLDEKSINASVVANLASRQNSDGAFIAKNAENSEYTVTDMIWSIVAMQIAKNNGVNVSYNKDKAVSALIKLQQASGSFDNFGMELDTTGMAIIALSAANTPAANTAKEKAVNYLKSCLDGNANLVGKGQWDSANSCAQAYGIIGLIAAGEDINSAKWTAGGKTVVDALLAYQDNNGGFWYDADSKSGKGWYTEPDNMSTYESIMALADAGAGKNLWVNLAVPSGQVITSANNSGSTNNTDVPIPDTGEKKISPIIWILVGLAVVILVAAFVSPMFKNKNDKK